METDPFLLQGHAGAGTVHEALMVLELQANQPRPVNPKVQVILPQFMRVVAKRRLPAKFAGWERAHRRLNFGWQALG